MLHAKITGAVALSLLVFAQLASAWDPSSLEQLPNVQFPEEHRVASGVIGGADIEKLREAGIQQVIDLRTSIERGEFDERQAVTEAGMEYHSIPIAGGDSLTLENARKLDEALQHAGKQPTLVHCSSANRVGALMALREAWVLGNPKDEALAVGERWGLTKLKDVVAAKLDAGARAED
jgi:uncharacterized protein (TIGR01244 family)